MGLGRLGTSVMAVSGEKSYCHSQESGDGSVIGLRKLTWGWGIASLCLDPATPTGKCERAPLGLQ